MSVPDDAAHDDAQTRAFERAMRRLNHRAAAIRTEQLARALSHLDDDGDLTDEQRAALERLSQRLVARLLAGASAQIRQSSNPEATARTVLELFD